MNFSVPKLDPIISPEKDQLNFNIASKKLSKIINSLETPSCFGLYGMWGSGKTSLMNLTKKYIDNDPATSSKNATVFFEAWKYEYAEVPITFNLLFKIQEELGADFDLKTTAKKMLSIGVASLINPLLKGAISIDASEALENLDNINQNLLSAYENWIRSNEDFQNEFETKVREALEKNNKEKLIIFIDDLDRCKTENVIKLLEEIKNYLTIKNVVFVIGVDKQVIIDAINNEYKYSRSYGDEYLKKIISNSISLPEISPIGIIKSILGAIEDQKILDQDEINIISRYLARFCKTNRRLTQIIFLKFLVCTQYINFAKLQEEIVPHSLKFSNMKALKLGVFRWCLIQEMDSSLFEHIDWEGKFVSGINQESKYFSPKISEISKRGAVHQNGQVIEDPLLPALDNQNIASILHKYIQEGLFIE